MTTEYTVRRVTHTLIMQVSDQRVQQDSEKMGAHKCRTLLCDRSTPFDAFVEEQPRHATAAVCLRVSLDVLLDVGNCPRAVASGDIPWVRGQKVM